MMIHKYDELGKANYGWLSTSYHFSFANYYDQSKVHIGSLRVLNDDYIEPNQGFDTHPHSDMEIVTYIVDGELTHQDSMGNKRKLGPYGVQYMSAGTGIQHSELNEGTNVLHLYQLWILPDRNGHKPDYGDRNFSDQMIQNSFLEIVSSEKGKGVIHINQEASIKVGEFDSNQNISIRLEDFKYSYLVVIDGVVEVDNNIIGKGDAIESKESYHLTVKENTHILLIRTNDR